MSHKWLSAALSQECVTVAGFAPLSHLLQAEAWVE